MKYSYESDTKLMYTEPAKVWHEALPIGNGTLGGMVFGEVEHERIDLNIDTLWSGTGQCKMNENQEKDLKTIREALYSKNYEEAEKLLSQNFLGDWTESYLPLGSLHIESKSTSSYEDYRRELDLEKAITTSQCIIQNILYEKEVFCSSKYKAIIVKLKATKAILELDVYLDSLLRFEYEEEDNSQALIIKGRAPIYAAPNYYHVEEPIVYKEGEGTLFATRVEAILDEGSCKKEGNHLHIQGASEIILVVTAETALEGNKVNLPRVSINQANYNKVKEEHVRHYQNYYNRVELKLGHDQTTLTTTKRLEEFKQNQEDLALVSLMFNYGRYLLISGSQPGSLPNNLQGIWNQKLRAPWSSNYTVNINTEMNYWPVEVCNLSECHEPLLDLIQKVSEIGKETAAKLYGLDGWVSHHNIDGWAHSTPVGGKEQNGSALCYAFWPMSSGWLCLHLWEHYAYTGDKEFLRDKAYPIILEAVRFYLEYLVSYEGYLMTMPSTSPENQFLGEDGKVHAITWGATMDTAILRELFGYFLKMIEILDKKEPLKEKVEEALSLLPPYKIGKYGQLQEWYEDYEEVDQHHRHVSHLYALYPSNQIDLEKTPELAKACEVALERRKDEGTGWSLAWKVNLWARLGNGNRAFELIKKQLRLVNEDVISAVGGGTYPNLFCAHPPFQIDGNFGLTAGICEMLLQSHGEYISLLPALPEVWKNGSVKGLKARGGFTLSFKWEEGKIIEATIQANYDKACKVILNNQVIELECEAGKTYQLM
nr:glycoside hydrolase N-terminal domain-containing protein [uncultured Niameybacter sp.]